MRTYLFQNPSYSRIFWALTLSMLVYAIGVDLAHAVTEYTSIASMNQTTEKAWGWMCWIYVGILPVGVIAAIIILGGSMMFKWFEWKTAITIFIGILIVSSAPKVMEGFGFPLVKCS